MKTTPMSSVSMIALLSVLTLLIAACSPAGQYPPPSQEPDTVDPSPSGPFIASNAVALFVAQNAESENTSAVELYQLDNEGAVSIVLLDDLVIDSFAPILFVAGVSNDFLLVAFGYSNSYVTSAWLYRFADQNFFDLADSIGGMRSMTNYYKDPPAFQYDQFGCAYFLGSDKRVHKIDAAGPIPAVSPMTPTGDEVDFFEVSHLGYIAYRTWTGDSRIMHPTGSLAQLPSRNFWRAQDGYIHLHHPHYESELDQTISIGRVNVDSEGTVEFTWYPDNLTNSIWPPHMSLKAQTENRVFIVDEDRGCMINEVYNPDQLPRTLDFLPAFSSIAYLTATNSSLIVSGFADQFRTYMVDPSDDSYHEAVGLTGIDVRSLFPLKDGRYVVNGLRLQDGKIVIAILESDGTVTTSVEEGDPEITHLVAW